MSAKVLSAAVVGLDAKIVEVEADISRGLPKIPIVGLPDTAVQEAKERVRSGIKNSGFDFPPGVVTVNLAPAHLKKEGPSYDLPIAMAILMARGEIKIPSNIMDKMFVGELSLNGSLRPVNGVLSVTILAKQKGIKELYVPNDNAAEAALAKGINIFPVTSLLCLTKHLDGLDTIQPFVEKKGVKLPRSDDLHDLSYIKGQDQAKRALEIAAAGAHNVLMTGPPGSGKTMLARTMPTIFPAMSLDESLEVTKIYSVAGLLPKETPLIQQKPFRAPHHTASAVALVGGGSFPKPGEISLAHRGVLFLDEFSEFSRSVLESLRQPLEDGVITVSRAAGAVRFPARFTLMAARNSCPCGYFDDPKQSCTCTPHQIIKYQKKISGPLLDRIDIHLNVPRLEYRTIVEKGKAETSTQVRQRVSRAKKIQQRRFSKTSIRANAEMVARQIEKYCQVEERAQELLKNAVNQLNLSARAYHRVLKVARTIADLDTQKMILTEHVAEALQYRPSK